MAITPDTLYPHTGIIFNTHTFWGGDWLIIDNPHSTPPTYTWVLFLIPTLIGGLVDVWLSTPPYLHTGIIFNTHT